MRAQAATSVTRSTTHYSRGDGTARVARIVSRNAHCDASGATVTLYDCRSRCSGRGTGDESNGSAIFKDEMLAVACSAPEQESMGRDAARFTEFLGGGREKNDRRSKVRQPNRRCSVRPPV